MALNTMYPPQKDSPLTSLTGDVLADDTIINVIDASALLSETPFPLTIGVDKAVTEVVLVTSVNIGTNQLSVQRTDGMLWPEGTQVARAFNASDLQAVQDNITLLESRDNHTGEQAISTITGLQAALDDKEDADPNIVVSSSTATDNSLARFDGDTGKVIKDSLVSIDNIGLRSIFLNAI